MAGSDTAIIGVDDTAISNGQRLRFRIYIDDGSASAMGGTAGIDTLVTYDGPTVDAAGDTWVQLPQTVSEFAPGISPPWAHGRDVRDRYRLAHR